MIIVIDSNIWIREQGLNSSLGAVTRYFIRQSNASVALPEVVRLETEHILRKKLNDYIDSIKEDHRQLLTLFGKLKEVVLPDITEVDQKVAEIFTNIGLELTEIPFSLKSARESFLKTIDGVPPSGEKNQQFKDGVIWSDCVELLKTDDVILVSGDQGFYQNRDTSKGLALNLKDEISESNHSFKLLPSLNLLLASLRTEVKLDEHELVDEFIRVKQVSVEGILHGNGFVMGNLEKLDYKLYATGNPNRLYVEFSIFLDAKDISGQNRKDGLITLKGDGYYIKDVGTYEDMRGLGDTLDFSLDDGTTKHAENYYLFGEGFLGHRDVIHTIKAPIDRVYE